MTLRQLCRRAAPSPSNGVGNLFNRSSYTSDVRCKCRDVDRFSLQISQLCQNMAQIDCICILVSFHFSFYKAFRILGIIRQWTLVSNFSFHWTLRSHELFRINRSKIQSQVWCSKPFGQGTCLFCFSLLGASSLQLLSRYFRLDGEKGAKHGGGGGLLLGKHLFSRKRKWPFR